jgi:hypothetical protein
MVGKYHLFGWNYISSIIHTVHWLKTEQNNRIVHIIITPLVLLFNRNLGA